MSIYDRIITSVPVDKVTSLVAYAKSQSGLSPREQEIENKKEELANIEKCILSMKNAKFRSYEEKKKINYKKRALQEEMSKLKMRLTTPPDIRVLQRQLKEARENHRPTKAVMRNIYLANPLHRELFPKWK